MRRHRLPERAALLIALFSACAAIAQPAPPPVPVDPSPPAGALPERPGGPAAASPPGAEGAGSGAERPPGGTDAPGALGAEPEVDDPMLQPVVPAPHVLRTWQEALRMARSRNSSMRVAAAQAELALAQSREALVAARPTIVGSAGVEHHFLRGEGAHLGTRALRTGKLPDPPTTLNADLELRVPVLAPRAWYDARTARESTRAAVLSAKDAQRVVLGATAEAIVAVVTAERIAEIGRVSLRASLANVDLNRRRAQLGAATAVDVLRAEQDVAASRAQIIAADEGIHQSREALGMVLGSAEAWGVAPSIQLDAIVRDALAVCPRQPSVDSRADVLAAKAKVDTMERQVRGFQRDFLPTVDALSNLTYWSDDDLSPNREHATWTVGAVLRWNIYDGGLRYARRGVDQGHLTVAREEHGDTQRRAELEVAQAARSIRVSESNLVVSTQARDLARESVRVSRLAFISGAGTSFDLVDATTRLRDAELDLAIAEFELVRAKILALLTIANCDV